MASTLTSSTATAPQVGGGKGELSLLLSLRGHACALVDPRPSAGYLSKKHRKQVHTMAHGTVPGTSPGALHGA